ncbi:MAG TPA: ROK family protein [Gaiellaceae bacterium]|nr:ROK family protein [Gaiellaceae bacterium]
MAGERVIGVDLGGTKILSGLIGRDGRIERRHEIPTPLSSQEAMLAGLDAAVEELLDDDVAALGFGIPSTIDQRRGVAVGSVNVPLHDLPFRDRMRERFELPVQIDNDANVAAIAEWKVGSGRGTNDMVMLTLGTGVGGGVIVGGRPLRGSVGSAGELGHMVIEFDGPPCQGVCRGRGHLEALTSGSAATLRAQEAFGPAVDAHRLIGLANDRDETALAILHDIGRKLGAAIGSLVNIFDPELIVLGGGFGAAAQDYLLGPALEVAKCEALEPGRQRLRIVPAELGSSAGLIGAGFVAFEALDG